MIVYCRPSLLVNALRCLQLLLTHTTHCCLTSDLIALIQPLIHLPICESYVIEILSNKNLSLSHLCSCSSITSLKYIFQYLILHTNNQYSIDDENKLLNKLLPDLISLYRHNEHDLSLVFSSYSPEYTHLCASILIQFSTFDALPNQLFKNAKKLISTEFDQIEFEWSRLKLLISINEKNDEENQLDFCSKINTYELNLSIFKRIVEIYEKHVRFIQQIKDQHLVRIDKFLNSHLIHHQNKKRLYIEKDIK